MMTIANKKEEFQELFNMIRSIYSNGVSGEDKKVIIDFLKTLRYTCEFDILKKCYDDNVILKNLIPDIDTKLMELHNQLDELQGKVYKEGELSSFEEVKLRAYQISYNRYSMIKDAILSRSFERYTQEMNKNLNSARQIISACSVSLEDVNLDFIKEFEIRGENKTPMDIAYDIQSDPKLLAELIDYYKKEKSLSVDYADSLAKDQEYLRYLQLAYQHQTLLRKYMLTLRKCGTSEENREVVCQERLAKNKLTRDSLINEFMGTIRNKRMINHLSALIEEDEETLTTIKESKEELEKLTIYIRNAGLGPVIDEFNYSYRDYTGSVEQRIVDFLKVTMRKKGLNITNAEKNVQDNISSLSSFINNKDLYLKSSISKMSDYGKELVTKYPEDTAKILEIITENKKSKVNPLLSAYVLKSLMTVQNLSFEEINDVINVYDTEGINELVNSFEDIVKSTINSIQEDLMGVYNRPKYDVNDLPNMKLM